MPDESRSSLFHLNGFVAKSVGGAVPSNVHFTMTMSVDLQFRIIADLFDLTFPKDL